MINEKNFAAALKVMGFDDKGGGVYEKIFSAGIVLQANTSARRLIYPAQVQGHERVDSYDESHKENLVVFECVNRLFDKGYKPADIELEKFWKVGHGEKGGRADIIVSREGKTYLIIECKTFGAEFNKELRNMKIDGGQLFSYWQQEKDCEWLALYASTFDDAVRHSVKTVHCNAEVFRDAGNAEELFRIWRDVCNQKFYDDVIFSVDSVAYKIGVRPLCKGELEDFETIGIVNKFEEILRHNVISSKETAFDRLISLFICKIVDEMEKSDGDEVDFQFKDGRDTYEVFQDRLQRLYHDGMDKFMNEPITYFPLSDVDDLLRQYKGQNRKNLIAAFKERFIAQKFYSNNSFAFMDVHNKRLFDANSKVLIEVVELFKPYKIIGAKDLQLLGDLFEQLLDKGFKQNEGQFFTPLPIARFVWDSLPLDEIIKVNEKFQPPKIIDYACGAGHFLTEGFSALNDCFERSHFKPAEKWESGKIFGVEKDYRLANVSKISLFMHGITSGTIKFGDGLENYSDGIEPETFDILVSNPPYSVKNFKQYIQLKNKFTVLDKISVDGSEIETLFVERIAQLLKPKGIAAVILPNSILNKDGKSFVAAREVLLQNFYIRAIAQFGSKTFSATGTNTVVVFLQKIFDPPKLFQLFGDTAEAIFNNKLDDDWEDKEILKAWLQKINVDFDTYQKFILREVNYSDWQTHAYFGDYFSAFMAKVNPPKSADANWFNQRFYDLAQKIEAEKIQYFAIASKQTTLIISAPTDNAEQENFLGYSWSNRKGDEGLKRKEQGGLLFDKDNRIAEDKLAFAVRAAFSGRQVKIPAAEKYFRYLRLSEMLDFSGVDFTKAIKLTPKRNTELKEGMKLFKLNSTDFEISIGNRVLSTEILDDGEIPVYSANVFEEFGRINKQNLADFSKPSIIWGIDGDWMVNFIPANQPFYPTDHCGVLRVNTDEIVPEYLAFVLRVEGEHEKFSRSNRASTKRIKSLSVQVPPLDIQQQIVDEFKALDKELFAQDAAIQAADAKVKEKFVALFGNKNFDTISLNKVCDIIRGVTYDKKSESQTPTSNAILTADNISLDGNFELKKIIYIANNVQLDALKKLRQSDIFICMSSGSIKHIGKTAFISKDTNFYAGGFMGIIRANNLVDEKFLFNVLNSDSAKNFFMNNATGSNIKNLSNSIGNMLIINPPLELQKEFASFAQEQDALKETARRLKEELLQARAALVEKYFR